MTSELSQQRSSVRSLVSLLISALCGICRLQTTKTRSVTQFCSRHAYIIFRRIWIMYLRRCRRKRRHVKRGKRVDACWRKAGRDKNSPYIRDAQSYDRRRRRTTQKGRSPAATALCTVTLSWACARVYGRSFHPTRTVRRFSADLSRL